MPHIHRHALLPYSSAQMFALVDDVERYPEFLPWCVQAEVLDVQVAADGAPQKRAALTLKKGPVAERFVTRNSLYAPTRILLNLDQGPFKKLAGEWRFTSIAESGCKVELELDFEVAGFVLSKLLSPILTGALDSLVDAFCARARQVYGAPP